MDAIKIARELGAAIQADERYASYMKAKEENDNDKALQDMIGQFNLTRMSIERELSSETKDDEKVKSLNEEMRQLYGKIMETESMKKYNDAKTAMDELVAEIDGIITMSINGEDPATCDPTAHNCSGSCATCGGCH